MDTALDENENEKDDEVEVEGEDDEVEASTFTYTPTVNGADFTDNEDGHPDMVFFVTTKVEKRDYTLRTEAVLAAKSWSNEEHASVSVEREDGRVKMTFRDGGLVDYVFETRKGRKA